MKGHKLLYGASLLMLIGFFIHMGIDYYQYCHTLNSAPFWIWIVTDGLLWMIPAQIAFFAGYLAEKKQKNKENTK